MSYTEQQISEATGFDSGELFESEQQVRAYFTPNNMKLMFASFDAEDDNPALALTEDELDAMADTVIEHRWHMAPTMIHTRDTHDHGFDLAIGRDISRGQVIGVLYWDSVIGDVDGWVLRFGDEQAQDDHLPDSVEEIVAILAARGYELAPESLYEIEQLAEQLAA